MVTINSSSIKSLKAIQNLNFSNKTSYKLIPQDDLTSVTHKNYNRAVRCLPNI